MKHYTWLLLGLLLTQCSPTADTEQPSTSDEELCNCVTLDAAGQWDGTLTQDCIEAYMERFDQDLGTIHEWYIEHCPSYQLKTNKQKVAI